MCPPAAYERIARSGTQTDERLEPVRIWLLGGFRVSVGPQTIEHNEWRLRKAASLVKLLALASHHRLHREQVMDRLWPDSGKRSASNSLRQIVHTTRKILDPVAGSRYLHSDNESLVLCPGGEIWVDVEAFEEAAATARRSKDPGAYRAALDLYAGELLPEDRYEEWAETRRAELRRLHLALLIELARLYRERGEHGSAVEALQQVVTEEPSNEEAHTTLMRLYAASERRGEALAQYERFREALSKELGTEPRAPTRLLREKIATGTFTTARTSPESLPLQGEPAPGKHNLPASRTSFVGREREMVEIKRELAMTRLLTLTGAGGSGKTRLALEVARDLVGSYPDGVWLVSLAELMEGALIPQAIAAALGVPEQSGRPLTETLVDGLRSREMLLVLDNCEHLIDAAARLLDILLDSCPRLRVLATSREPLGVAGEVRWLIPALSVPDPLHSSTVGELEGYESARLFVERASDRRPGFALTPDNAEGIAQICRQLDGIPLAMELAAARVGMLSVEQICERLNESLKLLVGGSRTAVPRQLTLRGTLDWSYELLSEPEQKLFGRLSVFAGGFTLEATEVVGSGNDLEDEDALELLSRLVEKSLVMVTGEEGVPRYRMLEPVRQYAQERLEESGESDAVRRRHAEFFLALAKEAEPELMGERQQAWAERLETEHDNLRAALLWSLENKPETALRLAGTLAHFWEIRSRFLEGSRWLEAALRQSGRTEAATRAPVLTEAGTFAWHRGDYEHSGVLQREALALYRQQGDEGGVAFSLMCLGNQQCEKGDDEGAVPFLEEALVLSRRIGDKRTIAYTLWNLAEVARHRGDYGQAKTLGLESQALSREMADKWQLARITGWLGVVTVYSSDDHDAAEGFLKESLALNREIGSLEYVAYCLEGFAGLAGARAQGARAARLWGAAEALRETISDPLPPADRPEYDRSMAATRVRLDEASWEAAFAEGKLMPLEEAVEYALLGEEEPTLSTSPVAEPPSTNKLANLTHREKEVASLVGRRLTNRQIASELVISERTVDHHVANILKKLDLHSREQITVPMTER
jgi:predicted ATPase/DNA-binding SARP family transcriptional activator/DNA-binding CsgD family transcriptional regulator